MEIYLGKGTGDIIFGLTENELESIVGSPDNIEVQEYGEDSTREYTYKKKNLSCSFSSEDEYRLSSIDLISSVFTLNGYSIVGSSLNEILRIFEKEGLKTPTIDSISNEVENNHLMLYYADEGLTLSFINYICDSFSMSPFWKNDEEILWPQEESD